MLLELRVRNFVLIEDLSLSFEPGFTVLTGETGAGKSLLIKALKLLLGERGGPEYLRSGEKEAVVEAVIEGGPLLAERLSALGLEPAEEVLLRRVITPERSRIYVNGSPVTLKVLAEITRGLIVLTGQHEFRSLLSPAYRLEILDTFTGLEDEVRAYREVFEAWREVRGAREALERELGELARRRDFLDFQIREIEEAGLRPGEDQELEREREVLRNLARLKSGLYEAEEALERATEALALARDRLTALERFDPGLAEPASRAAELYYETADLSREVSAALSDLPEDDSRLEEIEARLARLERLRRKYGSTVEEILETLEKLKAERASLETGEERLATLAAREEELRRETLKRARRLSEKRRVAARRLARQITEELADLALEEADFQVVVKSSEPRVENLTSSGLDRVDFLVRTNPGTPERPLEKIASGGELSRFFLALKSVLSQQERATCLVFDEVDAGIGGLTAVRVGEKLRELSRREQVICITHLPQIARMADHHLAVTKEVRAGETFTRIKVLSPEEIQRELSRMLGVEDA